MKHDVEEMSCFCWIL